MKLSHLWVACTTFVVAGVFLACSGSSTSTTGDGGTDVAPGTSGGTSGGGTSGGTSGSSGTSGGTSGTSGTSGNPPPSDCALKPGTYKSHYTKAAGSLPACTDIPDQTFEVKASDGGTTPPSPGCTFTTDEATCTFTTVCTVKNNGFTTNTNSHFSTKPPIGGSQTAKTTKDADGSVLSDCSYDFTYTLVK